MTKIKICGVRDKITAESIMKLDVDLIGIVFCKKSIRCIEVDEAEKIVSKKIPSISIVGLFSNDDEKYVDEMISKVNIDIIQFHGDETDEYCSKFNIPYIKGVSITNRNKLEDIDLKYPNSEAFIIDSHSADGIGGTGKSFDWNNFDFKTRKPIILAGGLKASNVNEAISKVKPYGVDVSSGVESSQGIKDINLVREFIRVVRNEKF
tara:strand:- start:1468 stop:2088 length:621 start_codon:yes stop_codon:yes gene_type:complete